MPLRLWQSIRMVLSFDYQIMSLCAGVNNQNAYAYMQRVLSLNKRMRIKDMLPKGPIYPPDTHRQSIQIETSMHI